MRLSGRPQTCPGRRERKIAKRARGAPALPITARSNRLLGTARPLVGLPLSEEPVGCSQGQCSGCKGKQLTLCDRVQIQNYELSRKGQQGNEQHNRGLDDALLTRDHVVQSVVEL